MACSTNADSVGLLKGFAALMAGGVVLSLLSGKTYFRRTIHRDEEPFAFWSNVVCMGLLAMFVLGMLWFCPEA